MPAPQILLIQIDARLDMLRAALPLLEAKQLGGITGGLGPHFAREFEYRKRGLEGLLAEMGRAQDAGDGWARLAQQSAEIDALYARLLDYIQSEIFRAAGLDQGAGIVADALLRELGALTDLPWRRQAAIGDADSFDEPTELIRVRFPQYTIWLVPIVAHELGHFAVSRLAHPDGSTAERLIAELAGAGLAAYHRDSADVIREQRAEFFEELFADVFATWVLGPAYACTCLMLALNPSDDGGRRHPPAAARAAAVIGCLTRLNSYSVSRPYADILRRLAEVWPAVGPVTSGLDVTKATSRFTDFLQDALPPLARYEGWRGSDGIREVVPTLSAAPRPAAPDAKIPLRTLLNAAWLARLKADSDTMLRRVGANAHDIILARARSLLGLDEIASV